MNYPVAIGDAFQVNGVWYQDYSIAPNEIKRFMHNGTDWVEAPTKIDLTKNIPNTDKGINLKKNVINLDKCMLNLSKDSGINLGCHTARVVAVMDYSGSMRGLYRNGSVQKTLDRLIPLGLRFDDNGEVDVYIFHDGYKQLCGMNLSNYDKYVEDIINTSGERFGSTYYAPVLNDIMNKYFKNKHTSYDDTPVFVIFITDGSNMDKRNTDKAIRESSNLPMFVQFIGIGDNDSFEYLRKLDDLSGRNVDNTGFIKVSDFNTISDDELYTKLLDQYVAWLKVTNRR